MPWWIGIALMIASYIISALFAPKPQDAKPAAQKEFDFPQIDEGTPQAVIFGEVWTEDWMIAGVGNYKNTPIRSSQGKK